MAASDDAARAPLWMQPMTAADAQAERAYAAGGARGREDGRLQGRREGFLEAVAIMRTAADGLVQAGGPILATVADGLRHVARQIETAVNKAGAQ